MRTQSAARRGGVAIVESALLLTTFLLFLFGILEYSRYMFLLHVAANAARDGARYGCVNVGKPDNFDYADATVGGVTYPSVWKYTIQRMGGADGMLSGCTVRTYPCDTAKLYGTSANGYTPQVTWKTGYSPPTTATYSNGTQTGSPVARSVDWNEATFGEKIAVEVSGTYTPILPNIFVVLVGNVGIMSGVNSVSVIAVVGSEG